MAKNYNPSIVQDTQKIFNLKAGDMLGSDLGSMIVPIVNVQRTINIVRNSNNTTSPTTIYTTPTDKEFYLTTVHLSSNQNVTSDNVISWIQVTDDETGVLRRVVQLTRETLTVQSSDVFCQFPLRGIRLKKGSTIDLYHAGTAGTTRVAGTITGYTVETI